MSFLTSIDEKIFLKTISPKPQGKYVHFIVLRITESYAIFQTDSELNVSRVSAGVQNQEIIPRLTIFKRKLPSPERLTGRALLRQYGIYALIKENQTNNKENKSSKNKKPSDKATTSNDTSNGDICDYNVSFCKMCPDCILYGFAIGDSGSEKSKVVTDSAFSITSFDISHEAFTLNAPYENGTMSRQQETASRINSQDHVAPQIYFPSIITLKDPTEISFLYVLNNLYRTKHYGAQTTRTGRVRNIVLGVVFSDAEMTSNLRLTQKIYDKLKDEKVSLDGLNPLEERKVVDVINNLIPELLKVEPMTVFKSILANECEQLNLEAHKLLTDETSLKNILEAATRESLAYWDNYIKK